MQPDLPAAAERLTAVLQAENAALAALDLPGATALLAEKEQAAAGLTRALAQPRPGAGPARAMVVQLGELAQENRRLLERAIQVQGAVIGTLARAAQHAGAQSAPRYGRQGALASAGGGHAFSARA